MKFSINSLLLWPKKSEFKYRELPFEPNKINVITGVSRTGKSSIIPIIDYCLGSTKCTIPVETIRNACSWFGVLFQLEDDQMLLCRQEPGNQTSTGVMYMQRAPIVDIPETIIANTTVEAVNQLLNELFCMSSLELAMDAPFSNRPSYRDMMAFLFQPQNIIANADVMFYKADTPEHRARLINVFPYALGAVTPRTLAAKQELDRLTKQRTRLERELAAIKDVSENWRYEINSWIAQARELGLTDFNPKSEVPFEEQVYQLSLIIDKTEWESSIAAKNVSDVSEVLLELRKKERELSSKLFENQKRYNEMVQLKESMNQYDNSLMVKLQRLEVSTWLRSLLSEEGNSILFNTPQTNSVELINTFCDAIQEIEMSAGGMSAIPAAFERELQFVEEQILLLTDELKSIRARINEESGKSTCQADKKYTLSGIARFLGKMEAAVQTYERLGKDEGLESNLKQINSRMDKLQLEVDENDIRKKITAALNYINLEAAKIVSSLDVEHPEAPVEFQIKDLTIRVQSIGGRKNYLSEIGSASNWLAYHIAVILAFQKYFQSIGNIAIPNFVIIDQPSQVYFPQLASKVEEDDTKIDDEDKVAVKKIFEAMSDFMKNLGKDMQIIVTEHADETVWGGIDGVHLVEQWRGNNLKLVPAEWID